MMKTAILVFCVSVMVVFTSSESVESDQDLVDKCKELEARNSFAGRWKRLTEFVKGAGDMWKAYSDMREAKHPGSDKYFRARGNYEATKRGEGGQAAAEAISDIKYAFNHFYWKNSDDQSEDRHADLWGRSLNDPNKFRPPGLDPKY